ncbi:hypothetical protein AB4453_19365 [Vibrio atlanticus]|jgi:hypothetical protein|uniref:Uncharacterized protein n=1 Tax=Vibrio atlanticus TaxID=693153 RepID=A0ABV4KQ13_9VIBR
MSDFDFVGGGALVASKQLALNTLSLGNRIARRDLQNIYDGIELFRVSKRKIAGTKKPHLSGFST